MINIKIRSVLSEIADKIFKGFIIGIAAITPGLSGGVIAAAYGIYEPAVNAVLNIIKKPSEGIKFLFPYGVGGIAGILLFSGIIKNLMRNSYSEIIFCFIGLVAGTLPALIKKANENGFKTKYMFSALAVFAGVIFLNEKYIFNFPVNNTFLAFIYIGVILSAGTVIPGVSSSFILIKSGLYDAWIYAITDFNISALFLTGISFALTSLLLIKIFSFLFKKFYGFTYYFIIGFLIATAILIFPGFSSYDKILIDLLLFFLGVILGFFC